MANLTDLQIWAGDVISGDPFTDAQYRQGIASCDWTSQLLNSALFTLSTDISRVNDCIGGFYSTTADIKDDIPAATAAEIVNLDDEDDAIVCINGVMKSVPICELNTPATTQLIASGSVTPGDYSADPEYAGGANPPGYFQIGDDFFIDSGIPTTARTNIGRIGNPRLLIPVITQSGEITFDASGDGDAAWFHDASVVTLTRFNGPHRAHIRIPLNGTSNTRYETNPIPSFDWELWEVKIRKEP